MQASVEDLRSAVMNGIRKVPHSFSEHHPGESLSGVAFVTDDGLETLGCFVNSVEFTARNSEPNVRFEPVEWSYSEGDHGFAEARSLLTARAKTAAAGGLFAEHVHTVFGVLVDCLRRARSEGLFAEDVFLTVISTDPSDELLRLEDEAVRALNSPELVQAWQAARIVS